MHETPKYLFCVGVEVGLTTREEEPRLRVTENRMLRGNLYLTERK
jgi:hypothetical protein